MALEVIEVPDGAGTEMVRRFPATGSGEFTWGSQVVVRESQTAVFFRDGQALDTMGPGRHTLSTLNMPLLTSRIADRIFGQSPFKAEVYFVNHNVFTGLKWGTRDPIAYRDTELSLVRLRSHGEMAVRVTNARQFVNTLVGARGIYQAKEIEGFLKSLVLSALAQTIGDMLQSVFDLPRIYDRLATATRVRVFDEFAAYGTELVDFVIEAISPPDEVQARIDERSGIAAIGDLDAYLRYKSALAIEEAAQHGGSGSALDAATGLGLGLSVMRTIQRGTTTSPNVVTAGLMCPACGQPSPPGANFCANCAAPLALRTCVQCGHTLTIAARFCSNCGTQAQASAE